MDFSFGVLSFNSEKYILEALYSIKYQIEHFMRNLDVQLVISDDGSTDRTKEVATKWTQEYKSCFKSIVILSEKDNKGTVNSYINLIRTIEAEKFHIFAADDLIAPYDLFEAFNNLQKKKCLCFFPVALRNDEIYIERRRLMRFLPLTKENEISEKRAIKYVVRGSYIHTPSTIFQKSSFTNETEKLVRNFILFEDDPRWYYFAKHKYTFIFRFQPIVIYRYHDDSVAHNNTSGQLSVFDKDYIHLNSMYLQDNEVNGLQKIYVKSRIERVIKKKTHSLDLTLRLLWYLKEEILEVITHKYRKEKKDIAMFVKECTDFYCIIKDEAGSFSRKFAGQI